MINLESYMNHFKNTLESILEEKGYMISISLHEEFYRNSNSDVDISFILIKGNIQCSQVQHPLQIIVQSNEDKAYEIFECLAELTERLNESKVTLSDNTTYREYYSTPMYSSKFLDKGITQQETIDIDASLVTYSNVFGVKELLVDNAQIKFTSFALNYTASCASTGTLYSTVQKQVINDTVSTIVFTSVPTNTTFYKKIIAKMINNSSPNEKFKIKVNFDYTNSYETNEEQYFVVNSASLTQESVGFPILTVTLARGE